MQYTHTHTHKNPILLLLPLEVGTQTFLTVQRAVHLNRLERFGPVPAFWLATPKQEC